MSGNEYTLLELLDLALCVPEVGAVNFNILHTIIKRMIEESGMQSVTMAYDLTGNSSLTREALKKHQRDHKSREGDRGTHPRELASAADEVREVPEDRQEPRQGEITKAESVPSEHKKQIRHAPSREEYARDDEYEDVQGDEDDVPTGVHQTRSDPIRNRKVSNEDVQNIWKQINFQRRLESTEDGIDRLSRAVDQLFNCFEELMDVTHDMKNEMERIDTFLSEVHAATQLREEEEDEDEGGAKTSAYAYDHEETKAAHETTMAALAADAEQSRIELENLRKELERARKEISEHSDKSSSSLNDILMEIEKFKSEMLQRTMNLEASVGELDTLKQSYETMAGESEKTQDVLPAPGSEKASALSGVNLILKRTQNLDQRFEDVWKELDVISGKLSKFSTDDETRVSTVELQRMCRKLNDEVFFLRKKYEDSLGFQKNTLYDIEQIKRILKTKVDRDYFEESMDRKVDKKAMDGKVDLDEYDFGIQTLTDAIEQIADNLAELEKTSLMTKEEMNANLKLKLDTSDYEKMQIPVFNRLRSLMQGFKRLKSLITSTVFPDAGAVTKCMCCGRLADLAGRLFAEGGDVDYHKPHLMDNRYSTDDLKSYINDAKHGKYPMTFAETSTLCDCCKKRLAAAKSEVTTNKQHSREKHDDGSQHDMTLKEIDEECDAALEAASIQFRNEQYESLVQNKIKIGSEVGSADRKDDGQNHNAVSSSHRNFEGTQIVENNIRHGLVFSRTTSRDFTVRGKVIKNAQQAVSNGYPRYSSSSEKPNIFSLPGIHLKVGASQSSSNTLNAVPQTDDNKKTYNSYVDKEGSRITRKFTR